MPLILPSASGRNLGAIGQIAGLVLGLAVGLGGLGCRGVRDPQTPPGPPIAAAPEATYESMDAECAGLVAALDRYGRCPNLEDGDRAWVRATIEAAEQSFAAGKKASPDEPAQRAIAAACHRAAASMGYATQRCQAGKRPRVD